MAVFQIRDVLIKIRIMLFSSVGFKMPTEITFNKFYFHVFLLITLTVSNSMVLKDTGNKLLGSHSKIVKTRVFLIILLVNERIRSWIRIRTNITDPGGPITSGSGSKNWVYESGSSSFFQKLTG
jgi:hypothetical protein